LNLSGWEASKWRAQNDDAGDRGQLLAAETSCNLQLATVGGAMWWHFMGHLARGVSITTAMAMPLKYLAAQWQVQEWPRKAGSTLFLGRVPSGKYCAYVPWTNAGKVSLLLQSL